MNKELSMGLEHIVPYPDGHVHNDIMDLITSINTLGSVLVSSDADFNGMSFRVSEELDDKLRDIPENKPTFEKLYQHIPPFFLRQSLRAMPKNEDGTFGHSEIFVVLCDEIDDEIRTYVKSNMLGLL